MDENRKEWQKPELIVLVRSKPEEVLLIVCKFPGHVPKFVSNWDDNKCRFSGCEDCTSQAPS